MDGSKNHKDRDQPVVLSRIYTRTGDDGTTMLCDMSRTRKTDPRLVAYADVEEANAAIGVALSFGELPDEVAETLATVQNELFDVGTDLGTPVAESPDYPPIRIDETYVQRLEEACDHFNAELETLRSFILPGGTHGGALLHKARVVARRAERSAWEAVETHGAAVAQLPVTYLNRLSDLLFVLGRVANAERGDVLWRPGGSR